MRFTMKKTIGIALALTLSIVGYGFGQAGAAPDGMVYDESIF